MNFLRNFSVSLPRSALLAAALLAPGLASATLVPTSGTVSDTSPNLTYTGGPIALADPQALCPSSQFCEDFPLTTIIPPAFRAAHPNAAVEVVMTFTPGVDMILKVLKGSTEVGGSDNGVGQPEAVTFIPAAGTSTDYKIRASVFAGAVSSYTVTVKLLNNDIPVGQTPSHFPRFAAYLSPPGLGDGAGEPSASYNRATKRVLFQAGLETLKVTFPEAKFDPVNTVAPNTPLPESCDSTWQDVSFPPLTVTTLDPIGTGTIAPAVAGTYPSRIYAGELGPKSHLMAFTDDDGANWTPSEGNVPGVSGVDHQTIGVSPYATTATPGDEPLTAYPYALYYCGQDIAYANCARSDNGGLTFGAAVPIYNTTQCGGLHGHLRGSPNGTVYVPNKGCGSNQGVSYSRDNGVTWTVSPIPDSSAGSNDPQAAVAADNSVYFCYGNGDGRPKAARGKFVGANLTWAASKDLGVGTYKGIAFDVKKVVFPQGVAGDGDRASCAFIGTETAGNTEALDFKGIWHAYIATTYDGGLNWVTIRASGDDPVQGYGGVCTSGTTCGANRNLLDFNDMTIDERGRPIFGFADGCVGACVNNPTVISRADKASIIKMVSDKTLFGQYDRAEPYAAKAACLAGTKASNVVSLSWKPPVDDGTRAVTGYNIYRASSAAAVLAATTPIASTGTKTQYEDDVTGVTGSLFYRVTAVNSVGEGISSNLIVPGGAPVLGNVCLPPGPDILLDPAGDLLAPIGTPTAAQLDIRGLSVSQPYFDNGDYKIYFHLKMQSMAAPLPTATWPVNFCAPKFPCVNPDTNTAPYSATNKYYTVRMTTDSSVATGATPTTPIFQVLEPTAAGTTAASRTITVLPQTTGNSGFTAAGLITFVTNASQIGLLPSGAGTQKLSKFQSRIAVPGGATPDNMPDGLAGNGEYATVGLAFCAPQTPPVADLQADKQSGNAPLAVKFTYSGTDANAIDSVVEFRLNYGDGSPTAVFTTPGNVTHTYNTADNYRASLIVKDSRNAVSASVEKVIEVLQATVSNPDPFTFIRRVNVPLNSFITSEAVTMSGYTGSLSIQGDAGLQYSINGGAFTNAIGQIPANAKLVVRAVSANTQATETVRSITVGGYTTQFTTVTTSADRVPAPFSFPSQSGLEPNTLTQSAAIMLKDYTDPAPIAVGPGIEYSLDGGNTYTTAAGTLAVNALIRVRETSNSAHLGYTKNYIKVGGVTGYFTIRTK